MILVFVSVTLWNIKIKNLICTASRFVADGSKLLHFAVSGGMGWKCVQLMCERWGGGKRKSRFWPEQELAKTGLRNTSENIFQDYAAMSSWEGMGSVRGNFFGTKVLEKKAEQHLLFSIEQLIIFQQGVYCSSFLTALILMPWSWIISRMHWIHWTSRLV